MKFDVLDMNGKKVSEIELSDAVFGITPNEKAVHAAVVNFLANQRQGTQSTKTRSEVSGGGRKPWRQKGTGHARQGSIRLPSGPTAALPSAPSPAPTATPINSKVKKLALKSAFSSKVQESSFVVVDKIQLDEIKTKSVVAMLKALGADKKALIVTAAPEKNVIRSANNIPASRPLWLTPSAPMTSSTMISLSSPRMLSPSSRRCTRNEDRSGHHYPPHYHRGLHGRTG